MGTTPNNILSPESITYLEHLSKLNINDKEAFFKKFGSIVKYLEHIQDVPWTQKNETSKKEKDTEHQDDACSPLGHHRLNTIDTVTPAGTKKLLDNVDHEVVNNSIVVSTWFANH